MTTAPTANGSESPTNPSPGSFYGSSRYRDTRLTHGEAERKAAWELYVELRTRIATQELPLHSGDEGTALKSLHDLFGLTRTVLAKHGPEAGELGAIVMAALNEDLRPLTAYWHRADTEGSFARPDECGDFRSDLRAVQRRLSVLTDFLQSAARGNEYATAAENAHPSRPLEPGAASTTKGAAEEPSVQAFGLERASMKKRRDAFGVPDSDGTVGLALSGGGIRSATFSAGVLSALSAAGLYRYFDYLSTVSGGGYTGTLISTWATSVGAPSPASPDTPKRLMRGPFADGAAIEHLRDRSRYLVDGGLLGAARILLPMGAGILASLSALFISTPVVLALTLVGDWVVSSASGSNLPPWALAGAAVVALLATRFERSTTALHWLLAIVALLCAPWALITGFDAVLTWTTAAAQQLRLGPLVSPAVVGLLPLLATGLGKLLSARRQAAPLARGLLALSPSLAFLGLITLLWRDLDPRIAWPPVEPRHLDHLETYGFALLLALVVVVLTDVNRSSLHGYYRDRLVETYCVGADFGPFGPKRRAPLLEELTQLAPIHLINATANLPATKALNDRGRRAAGFVFSRHGWSYPTSNEGRLSRTFAPLDKQPSWWWRLTQPAHLVDIGTAMAISGAAVSPMMGTSTPDGATPWLTLFNFRLGFWFPKPGRRASLPWGGYLVRELFGQVDEGAPRLNLSDGGHLENLGVYELVRRQCRYIIVIDGEADPELRCDGLMNLVRLARIDFGATIRVDVRKLRLDAERLSAAHFAIGDIKYQDGTTGLLLYIKLSVTGDEPGYLLGYREKEPAFPHHSTAGQLYSEEQFEAYRALGAHIGERLFRDELIGSLSAKAAGGPDHATLGLGEWMEAIRVALLRSTPSWMGTQAQAARVAPNGAPHA